MAPDPAGAGEERRSVLIRHNLFVLFFSTTQMVTMIIKSDLLRLGHGAGAARWLGRMFVLFVLLAGALPAAAAGSGRFLLLYGNDVRGETEPCG